MSSRSPRRSGLARFWAVLAATVAALAVVTVALPSDAYIRYQSLKGTIYKRAQWIYERIHFDPAPIDVLFIGSSRTGQGVNQELLQTALAERGLDLSVANFSLPSSGLDIRDTLLRETLTEKSPKLVVISVVEALPRDGHEAWGEIAPAREVLTAPWIVNRHLPGNLLRLPIRQIDLAAATLAPAAWGYRRSFDPAEYAALTEELFAPHFEDEAQFGTPEHAATLAAQARRRYRDITPPILPKRLSWIEFGVSQSYLADMVRLAHAHGAKVAFLFLPFYTGYKAPIEAADLSAIGPLWEADFLREDPRNYVDSGHSANTLRVKTMLTSWLADRVAAALAGTDLPRLEGD